MLKWFAELRSLRERKLRSLREKNLFPLTKRNYICFLTVTLIFITANSMLESLGFGSGRPFSDIPNVILSAFWAGGVSVFLMYLLVWIEWAVRRILR